MPLRQGGDDRWLLVVKSLAPLCVDDTSSSISAGDILRSSPNVEQVSGGGGDTDIGLWEEGVPRWWEVASKGAVTGGDAVGALVLDGESWWGVGVGGCWGEALSEDSVSVGDLERRRTSGSGSKSAMIAVVSVITVGGGCSSGVTCWPSRAAGSISRSGDSAERR